MKIISAFKDFYDHSPNILGFQPDETHIFYRNTLYELKDKLFYQLYSNRYQIHAVKNPTIMKIGMHDEYHLSTTIQLIKDIHHKYSNGDMEILGLFYCGKSCIIVNEFKYDKLGKPIYIGKSKFLIQNKKDNCLKTFDMLNENDIDNLWVEENNEIFKNVGSPIFTIGYECLFNTIPCLSKLGVSQFMDIHKTYHEIEHYICSVLNDNNVLQPTEIANEYKIQAAGFDLKTSFRHPIK